MADEAAFDGVAFLGMARSAKRDPYRLGLFARHLEPGERPLCLLPVRGGTLLATDRRLLELRAHFDVHGAWNVQEFLGYEVHRAIPRESIRDVRRETGPSKTRRGESHDVEDALAIVTPGGDETVVVSRGPAAVLTDEEFARLRSAILAHQPK